jgi:hypothetical protein
MYFVTVFHNVVICCFLDRINRHCGQMHVFVFRMTSLTAQTKVLVHSDQFRSPLGLARSVPQ